MNAILEDRKTGLHTISVYVANKPGVLARIAQVYARRGFNIESLVVSPSKDGEFSRMTITVKGAAEGFEQIIMQTNKLIDVIHCIDHTGEDSVVRELCMVKVAVQGDERAEALQISEHFGCKTVDLTPTSMIIMVTGASDKVDACVRMLSSFQIVELVRTGKVVMARGDEET